MPQNRRRVAFSNKQKKVQLQEKREKKRQKNFDFSSHSNDGDTAEEKFESDVRVLNEQPYTGTKHNPNRYNLMFKKEKDSGPRDRLSRAMETLNFVPQEALEVAYEDVFQAGTLLDMPKRPPWDYAMSKDVLEAKEQRYFREYVSRLETQYSKKLSHFEMNIETWRQLWRVLEFSDIVLLVTDIRHPVLHFSPALYDYVTKEMKKDMIVVFNKIDLVDSHVVVAWKSYFEEHFPKLRIMYFASYAGMKIKQGNKGKRIGKLHMAIKGSKYLLKLCEDIVNKQVDLTSWHTKIEKEAAELKAQEEDCSGGLEDSEEGFNALKTAKIIVSGNDTSCYNEERYKDGTLTIGFVGHPNVGKSSFLNAVLGKKVVSVSRTPGHTKHYQTIMLTPTVRLCDCPGLVFPSLVPKAMQVLMGCFPIAQLKDPYPAIKFLAKRLPLHKLLGLQHPEFDAKQPKEEFDWSSYDICSSFAEKRGFHIARSARPDVHRAANNILRMALDGRTLCLVFYPPGFFKSIDEWQHLPENQSVKSVQKYLNDSELSPNEDEVSKDAVKCTRLEDSNSENDDVDSHSGDNSDEENSDSEEIETKTSSRLNSDNMFSLLEDEM